MTLSGYSDTFGILYMIIGIFGSVCNLATALIIMRYRIYRLSAYTLMANIAIADTVILILAGFICGSVLLQAPRSQYVAVNSLGPCFTTSDNANSTKPENQTKLLFVEYPRMSQYDSMLAGSSSLSETDAVVWKSRFNVVLSFCGIAAWITNGFSYAFLGLNRCVAICFFHTKARVLNTVRNAIVGSSIAWIIGIIVG